MKVDLLNGNTVEVLFEEPIVGVGEIATAQAIIDRHYASLLSRLPPDHAWNGGKARHQRQTADTLGIYIEEFAIKGANASFLQFLGGIHDIGRPIQGMEQLGLPVPEKYRGLRHGLIAISLLEEWGALEILGEKAANLVRSALGQHDLPVTLAWDQSDPLVSFVLRVIRDADKLAGLLHKTRSYLWDAEEKRKQLAANNLAGEQWAINPARLVDQFADGQVIKNGDCVSYEAFALRVLAWIHDLNLLITRRVLRESGVIYEYVRYFREQRIPVSQLNRITNKVELWIS